MKKKTALIPIVLMLLLSLCFQGCNNPFKNAGKINIPTNPQTAFSPVDIGKSGNHTYYDKEIFTRNGMDQQRRQFVEKCMKDAEKSLQDDVFVTGTNNQYDNDMFRLFGYAYKNGVMIEGYSMTAEYNSRGVMTWYPYDSSIPLPVIDTSNIRPATDFYNLVYNLAEPHKNEMILGGNGSIRGDYALKSDLFGKLYYDFNLNEYSHIWIDANDGTVRREYYWNGVYVD